MKPNINKIIIFSIVFALWSCGDKKNPSDETKVESEQIMDDRIQVTQRQFKQSKMALGSLEEKSFPTVIIVNGMIENLARTDGCNTTK